MKKRLWLPVGIAVAACGTLLLNMLWYRTIPSFDLLFFSGLLSASAFAAVFGLFYLHLPETNRSLRAGTILGFLTGLLIGLYRYFEPPLMNASVVAMEAPEIARIALLGALAGASIAVSELRLNPNRKRRTA